MSRPAVLCPAGMRIMRSVLSRSKTAVLTARSFTTRNPPQPPGMSFQRWALRSRNASSSSGKSKSSPGVDGLRGDVKVHALLQLDGHVVADLGVVVGPGVLAPEVVLLADRGGREHRDFGPGHHRFGGFVCFVVDPNRDLVPPPVAIGRRDLLNGAHGLVLLERFVGHSARPAEYLT